MHIEIAKERKKCVQEQQRNFQLYYNTMQDSKFVKLQRDTSKVVTAASWYLKGSASLEKSCTTAMFWLIWHNKSNNKKQQQNQRQQQQQLQQTEREAFTPKQQQQHQHKTAARLLLSYCLNCRRQHLQHDCCLVCCQQQKKQTKQCKCSSNSSLLSLSNNNTTNENTATPIVVAAAATTTTTTKAAQFAGKMHSSQTSTGKCSCRYYCFCYCSNCCLHCCRYQSSCCYFSGRRRRWHVLFRRAKFKILLFVAHNRNSNVNVEYNNDDDDDNDDELIRSVDDVVIQKNKFMTSHTTHLRYEIYNKASPICLSKRRNCSASIATSRHKVCAARYNYFYLLRTFLSARNLTKVYVKNLTNSMQQQQQQQHREQLHATTTRNAATITTFTRMKLAKAKQLMNKCANTTIITIICNKNNTTMKRFCIRQDNSCSSNVLSSRRHKFCILATYNKNTAAIKNTITATGTTTNCSNITIANESLPTALHATTTTAAASTDIEAETAEEDNENEEDDDEKEKEKEEEEMYKSNEKNILAANNNNNELAAVHIHYDDVDVHYDSLMAKSMWKVETCQPWCSFILFIEKQIRNEKNLLTNIFYTKQQATVISTCSSNNNNHNQYNNNNNSNSSYIKHISNNSGQTKCPELQRLNSQRDYDTSKYNNREICRFLNKYSYKTNTIDNEHIKNKHNLNNCNNKFNINNYYNSNIQQKQQINNHNINNTEHIHQQHNFMQMNNNNYNNNNDNVHKDSNNYISQLQQKPPPQPKQIQTELQQIQGNQKQQQPQQQKHYPQSQSGNVESIACCMQRNATTAYKKHHRTHFNNCNSYRSKYNNNFMNAATKQPLLRILLLLLTLAVFATAHAQNLANSIMTNAVIRTTSATSSSLPSSTTMPVTLTRNETVCRSLDLRNTPSDFRQLENCTVVEGFLLLSLVNTHTQMEFNETYPLLTEVSEFIIVYRVHNLRSLAQIFPNLAIIRGRVLFEGYALAVYSNPHLEELGLTKLISISRGAVRIENNLSLCFVQTVHWEAITNSTENVIRNNRPPLECPLCPGDHKLIGSEVILDNELSCKKSTKTGKRHCWNSSSCQTLCPDDCRGNCMDEHTCCNEACIGGCLATNPSVCIGCRNFSIDNNTCIDKCPPTYFNYVDRRCITAENCAGIGTKYENNKPETLIAYNGNCTTHCPAGYAKVNSTCEECGDKCVKKCEGGLIDSVQHAKDMNGCTHIGKEGLTISIKRGGRFLMEDLEYGLSAIKVIDTYLKVHLTYGMYSLEFFKSLETIRGQTLYENRFSLYVLENNDLERIWGPKQQVRLENGRVFFHFNPKLCYSEIEKLLPMMRYNTSFDRSEVATDSNGSKGSCNTDELHVQVFMVTSHGATVEITNPLKFDDERTFIGYIYYFIEDKFGNATKHGYRPCDDGWTPSDPTKETKYLFQGLTPFTQYAYYVKTMTISMEPRNAQSEIGYFQTRSSQPQPVQWIKAYANSSSEIVLNWAPPKKVNGKLAKYKVRAVLNRLSQAQELESRNYCKNPLPMVQEFGREMGGDVLKTTDNPQNADCRCGPGEKPGSSYSDEADTPTISEAMSFENAVQNFVYVKHSNATSSKDNSKLDDKTMRRRRRRRLVLEEEYSSDSYLLRHMRDVPMRMDEGAPYTSLNESKMDASGTFYEIVVDYVNSTTTQYVFTKLKHFAIYHLSVEACREPEKDKDAPKNECSNEKEQQVRTQKMENVDKVHGFSAELEMTNNTRSVVRLRWKPPENPNGMIVSYTIAYQLIAEDAVEEKKCITDQDYRKLVDGYVLSSLPIGNHSIRVRSNTLAGEGVYSEPVYVDIPPTRISNTVIAIIVLTIVSFLLMVGAFLYYLRKKLLPTPSDLKMFPSVNPYYISLQYIPDDWEVSRERVIQLSPLGQGSFGMVYEGILKSLNEGDEDTPCAIKTVNENATDRERMNFLNEASVMKQFDTYHVVRLLGVCSRGQPALVVMELMKNGDLKSYLRAHRPDEREDGINGYVLPQHEQLTSTGGGTLFQPPPLSRIYQMAIEIADGMAYLSAKKFVHRDLAARNCMVAADLTVKIGDFGMTRDIYETDYYRKGTKGLLPVRWMPPESLRDGVYSSSSDVFSYGVVLWEMATLASQPYQGLSNDQVLRYVIDGGVMERPENCPDQLYRLMQNCWHHRPSARPSFMEIITHLLDHANETFRTVSFYHSEEGEQVRQKEMAEKLKHSDDIFHDRENEMDDVTTPLRVGEYNEYKMNMGNNSSVENQDGSPIALEDEPQHSAYSMGSDINASSTPEGQLHTTGTNMQLFAPKMQLQDASTAGYVHAYLPASAQVSNPIDIVIQKSMENEERGYEVYDPSPHYQLHTLDDNNADDGNEDDEADASLHGGMVGERLLPRKKRQPRVKTSSISIRPMSSSMPDETVGGGMTISSSLHPSTASAASSNASSTATATSKYPSLKKTVADTMHNVGHNLRNINKRLFQSHKRSGSTGSQKSIQLHPTPAILTSTTNMGPTAHLATIESGGSGSAGSYCISPRFFTPAAASDNPNYQPYDIAASANYQALSENPNYEVMQAPVMAPTNNMQSELMDIKNAHISDNPNYQMMESLPTASSTGFSTLDAALRQQDDRQSFLGAAKSCSSGSDTFSETEGTVTNAGPKQRKRKQNKTQKPQIEETKTLTTTATTDAAAAATTTTTNATTTTTVIPTTTTTSTTTAASLPHSRFSLKEKWLRQQQQQQAPSQQSHLSPPPNGFIG